MADSDENPMECNEFGLSNEETVSLFSASLNTALEKQSNVIVSTITGLTEQLGKSIALKSAGHVPESRQTFEFKHEGHKIQFAFNQDRLFKLSEIEVLIQEGDFTKTTAVIAEEKTALQQRNKILKIADRHGWDTVHEYLDDPLADNTEDAAKLRYAVGRAARKRSFRSKPYERRRESFAPSDLFRGFSQSYNSSDKFNTGAIRVGTTGFQFQRDRGGCFYCWQVGHLVRDCPYLKGQSIPSLSTSTTSGTSKQ
ncbi:uncharacterized protein LOC133176401 [Saccostrea echinata]|uniref:uncharacterized protein LOC133176401 n=1 Tax=Saccostrea echinata TaxID=191078 RepID=UPI002A828C43|nr:uncharacterized protein LOC133176401 [Saccostrea echinata]